MYTLHFEKYSNDYKNSCSKMVYYLVIMLTPVVVVETGGSHYLDSLACSLLPMLSKELLALLL
jgi:hypothetical protein